LSKLSLSLKVIVGYIYKPTVYFDHAHFEAKYISSYNIAYQLFYYFISVLTHFVHAYLPYMPLPSSLKLDLGM